MAINWAPIREEYITSYISQREIAKKYGITSAAVNIHASNENWLQQREEYMRKKKEESDQKKPKPSDIPGLLQRRKESNDEETKPGSRENYERYAIASLDLPPIDVADPIQVEERINDYFKCCYQNGIKPQKPGMAKWLKISTSTLDNWYRGEFRKLTHKAIIEDAFTKLEEDLYDQVQSGHVNPGSGIFLLKNMFGYKDVQDIVMAQKDPLGELQDPEALRKRIEGCIVVDVEEVQKDGD